jgi:hypothetical protein
MQGAAMSRRFSVCNGDADGLTAAVQWLMHEPGPVHLVTGLKHERALLDSVDARAGDEVNIFDLALQPNRSALMRLLDSGARVRYFDHHALAGEVPHGALFEPHLDTTSETCTSLLVDQRIGGACHGWALVGAYGDNLCAKADRLAAEWGFVAADRDRLRRLGDIINYNAYGDDETDVRIPPAALYEILARYRDPLDMMRHEAIVDDIDAIRCDDVRQGLAAVRQWQGPQGAVHVLPDAPWSRRVSGVLANELANLEPSRAHAVLRARRGGGYMVSVRAPLHAPHGADVLCSRFGGGGRAAAAGVDHLPADEFDRFVAAFSCMG